MSKIDFRLDFFEFEDGKMKDVIGRLLGNIRFYVLCGSISWGGILLFYALETVHSQQLQIIRLTQWYALSAIALLYVTLFVGPLSRFFRNSSFIQIWLKARRSLGVSAFLYGLAHSLCAFFGQLGGFSGLSFLDNWYLFAVVLSFSALIIFSIMAATSFDFVIAKLKYKRWKMIHRLVYVAGVFVLIHAVMLGTHFQDLSSFIPVLLFLGLAVLLLMHALLVDRLLSQNFENYKLDFGWVSLLVAGAVVFWSVRFLGIVGPNGSNSFNVHAQHIQIAKDSFNQTMSGSVTNSVSNTIPGLQGDRSKRFTVSFLPEASISAQKDVTLRFKVNDASSGDPVIFFQKVYEKVVHMIVVDSELKYFSHVHPDQTAEGFSITTQFPEDGLYHLYIDFQPVGAIEQQFAFTVTVGANVTPTFSTAQSDSNMNKKFGNYEVSLFYPQPLISSQISTGQQQLKFTIRDKNGNLVTNLKPYLAAFGHLVMINEKTFEYVHVHPVNLTPPLPDQNGGPDVTFLPLGLYGPIKPGMYRVFAQFNPNNELFTADFTVEVK